MAEIVELEARYAQDPYNKEVLSSLITALSEADSDSVADRDGKCNVSFVSLTVVDDTVMSRQTRTISTNILQTTLHKLCFLASMDC